MIGNVNQPSTHLIMDADGTLKENAVDVAAVIADTIITDAKHVADAKVGSLATLTTTEKTSAVAAINEINAKANGGINLIADPFFEHLKPPYNFGSNKSRWLNAFLLSVVTGDAANPHVNTLRHNVASGIAGMRLWINEVGVKVGDTVTVVVKHKAPVGETYLILCAWYNASNVVIGSATSSGTRTGDGTAQSTTLTPAVVPSGAAYLQIYNQNLSATQVDWCAVWAVNGASAPANPPPGGNAAAYPAFDAIGVGNIFHSAFWDNCQPNTDWGSRSRWFTAAADTVERINADPDNPYGGNTLRFLYGGAATFGVKLWLDEIGVGVGDLVKLALPIVAAAGSFVLQARYYTAAGGALGSSTSSGTITATGVPYTVQMTIAAVPATAAYLLVYIQRTGGTEYCDIYGLWATKGTYLPSFPTPTGNLSRMTARLHDASGWDYDLTTVTVAASGADYTTIAAALAAITPTPQNRYRILLAEETFTEQDLTLKNWVVLEGMSRQKSIIDGTRGSVDLNHDTIIANVNCIIRNVTVKAHNVKYCVHIDATLNPWTVLLDNCYLWHDTGIPVGIGGHVGQYVEMTNCVVEYAGSSATQFGVFFHNWNDQTGPCGLMLDGCDFRNCGIVNVQELGSENVDRVRVIDCLTNCLDRGISLTVQTAYWDGGGHTADEIPYNLSLSVQGGRVPYFDVNTAHRPLLDWHIPGWDTEIKNVNAGTLAQGTAVAYKYSSLGLKMDVDIASATRCDGVLLADVAAGAQGWMVQRGNAAQILCDTAAVLVGAWLKPNASTGEWEAATEATALAVALGTKSAGSAGLVKARLL